MAQSNAVYGSAPDHDVLSTSGSVGSVPVAAAPTLVIAVAAAVAVGLAVGIGALVFIAGRNRRRAVPGPYAALSPDGNYWWDGSSWQPVVRR